MREVQLSLFEENLEKEDAFVYIDLNNIFHRYRKMNWVSLRHFLSSKINIKRITGYNSVDFSNQKQLAFNSYLSANGYRVKTCDSRINTNIDGMLITDMCLESTGEHKHSNIVLIANDGDYGYPLDRLSSLGFTITVIGTKGNIGQELLRISDSLIYLEDISNLDLI